MGDDIKYRLKQAPTDVWSIREKLALASSVMRSGDQNWVSVSRAIKPFGNTGRPDDWFSQKNCALQYSALLEKVETPRRKRGEREVADTPGDVIVRKLTVERIEELKRIIQDEKVKYRSLKSDLEMVRSGQMDHQIKDLYEKMQAEKRAAEEAALKKAADERTARELAKAAALRLKKPMPFNPKKLASAASDHDDSTQDSIVDDDSNHSLASSVTTPGPSRLLDPVAIGTPTPSSPLLTQLLTNPPKLVDVLQASTVKNVEDSENGFMSVTADDVMVNEELVDTNADTVTAEEATDIPILHGADDVTADDSSQDTVTAAAFIKIDKDIKQEDLSATEISAVNAGPSEHPATSQDSEVVGTPTSSAQDIKPVISDEITIIPETSSIATERSSVPPSTPEPELSQVESCEEKPDSAASNLDVEDHAPPKGTASLEESEELPVSPASSVMSTEAAAVAGKTQSTSRRSRGDRTRRSGKRTSRVHQSASHEDTKEPATGRKVSEVDTSEDETNCAADESTMEMFALRRKIDLNESLPNSPASYSHSDTEDEKAHKIWKKSIMLVWRSAANHKFANVFMHKVNEDIAPGYHSIVHRPMDLTMIKKNIDMGTIRTTAEFQRDMMLMFINAMMYNNVEHDVHKMAVSMYNDVMMHIEHFVNTQMMVQSEPKLLRTLRRNDPHSDKEDEQKKRKAPEPETQTPSGGKVKKRR